MTWTLEHLLSGMADATVKATALLLAAALATLLVRRSPAASRHFVWSLAAAGTLALPLLAAFLPSWRVAVLPPPEVPEPVSAVSAVDVDQMSLETLLLLPRAEIAPAQDLAIAVPAPPPRRVHRPLAFRAELLPLEAMQAPLVLASEERVAVPAIELPRHARRAMSPWASARPWLGALWMAGCALALLKILAGRIGVRLLSRRAAPVTDLEALAVLERLRRRMGISRPVRMLRADRATLPMTWGTLHPVVLLPADAHAWTEDRLEVVLLHELAHVRRLDALTQLVAQVACAVYWFHPLVWLAARRMRALREYACDDHVLNAGTRASAYAGEMLEMVRSLRSDPLAPASATLAMARRSHFEGRLMAILDPNLRRSAFGSRAGMVIGAIGLMVLMPLAALQPTAAAQPLPRLSTKESEKRQSTSVPVPTVAPAPSAAPVAAPVVAPAPAPAAVPAPPAPPAPPALAAPPAPPAPPADDPYRLGCLSRADQWKIVQRDDHLRAKAVAGGACKVAVEATGTLFFTPNLSAIAGMSPGAAFHAEERNGDLARSFDMRADGAGKVTREWRVNGQARPVDAEAKMFVAALLAQLDRTSGFPSAHRMGQSGDVDAARAAAAAVADVNGRGQATPQAWKQDSRGGARDAIDQAAAAAHSDDELLGALRHVAGRDALEDPGAREAFLRACDRFRSGEARSRALRAFLMAAPIDPETGRAVLASTRGIQAEEDLLAVLKTMREISEADLVRGPLVMSYLEAAERLRSEEAMTRALVWLLHPDPVAREGVLRSLDLIASRLRSDEAKHRALVEVTDHQALDPQVKARYLQIVTAMRDAGLQADSKKRLEHARDCDADQGKTAVNIQVGRLPIRVQVDAEQIRRDAEQMAREAERQGREAAVAAKRIAEETARHERLRERAREEAEEARRQWTAEGEKLRAEAEKLKAQARQLNEQMRERARRLKQKLSKELPPDEVDELDLDSLDDLDFEL